jgi:hypothetical protein
MEGEGRGGRGGWGEERGREERERERRKTYHLFIDPKFSRQLFPFPSLPSFLLSLLPSLLSPRRIREPHFQSIYGHGK